jgi:predicted DNA-binding antitoxin AbrB/MazE fold protein
MIVVDANILIRAVLGRRVRQLHSVIFSDSTGRLINRDGRMRQNACLQETKVRGYPSAMIATVNAIYEDGKLVLQQPLPLPEHAHVRVTIDTDLEREAWLKLSEESLRKVWDNDADDIFNDLLEK